MTLRQQHAPPPKIFCCSSSASAGSACGARSAKCRPNVSEFLNRQPKQLQNSTKQNQTTTKQLLTTLNNPIKVKSAWGSDSLFIVSWRQMMIHRLNVFCLFYWGSARSPGSPRSPGSAWDLIFNIKDCVEEFSHENCCKRRAIIPDTRKMPSSHAYSVTECISYISCGFNFNIA